MKKKVNHIDAKGRVVGRLATEISVILQGKHRADYLPYQEAGEEVIVKNVDQMKITGQKRENKVFYHHSGYLGGLKKITLGKLMEKRPAEVLRKAVWNMLPKNRLRSRLMKNLKFE